jgi:arylsulfatase A
MMKRRDILKMAGVAGIAVAGRTTFAEPKPAKSLPNIVLINADDLGYGDLGCYGATKVKTPNIDKLAKQGRRFTDAHSASAVCTPSRYGLLTGEYPFRALGGKGQWGPLPTWHPLIIPETKTTLASLLKREGYATACVGKWHLGFTTDKKNLWQPPLKPGPNQLGFDYYFGVPLVNSGSPFVYVENDTIVGHDPKDPMIPAAKKNGVKPSKTPIHPAKSANYYGGAKKAHALYDDEKIGTTLAQKSVAWLKAQKKDTPFFLYLPTTNIHHPFTPAEKFKGTSECGRYGDFIHELDWIVGEVTKTLDEMGVADNTLLIFTSDNGGMMNHGGQDAWRAGHHINGDLLGFKFGIWEGGHRVPMIVRWPGKVPADTTSDQLISQIDMLGTFAAVTGQKRKPADGPDSVDMLPALTGTPAAPLRESLVLVSYRGVAIRKGEWMYIPNRSNSGWDNKVGIHAGGGPAIMPFTKQHTSDVVNGKIRKDAPPAQLYNLKTDLAQSTNRYHDHPEIVEEMRALLKQFGVKAPAPKPAKPAKRPRPKKKK